MPIICVEGIDGSGKTKQIEMLCNHLGQYYDIDKREYPVYDSFFGSEIGLLLAGKINQYEANSLDPKSMALWFALDRWFDLLNRSISVDSSTCIILNRYTLSNMVYQSLRRNDGDDISNWIETLEQDIFQLPKPDLYIILDIDPEIARKNIDKKKPRIYIDHADIYEENLDIQNQARDLYIKFANERNNIRLIDSMIDGKMKAPEVVHKEILGLLYSENIIKEK